MTEITETRPPAAARLKVYYNSACPVCDAGITAERCRLEAAGSTSVDWLDVHANPERAADVGANLEYVRERLHVRTPDGTLHVGFDALVALLAQIPRRRWLARLLAAPVLHGIGVLGYNIFARALYTWNRRKGHW